MSRPKINQQKVNDAADALHGELQRISQRHGLNYPEVLAVAGALAIDTARAMEVKGASRNALEALETSVRNARTKQAGLPVMGNA